MRVLERRLKRTAVRVIGGLSSDYKLDFKDISTDSIKRILLVKRHELGDFLLFSPVLPAVRKRFPDARMVICTRGYTKDVVLKDPLVDDVLIIHERLSNWRVKDLISATRCLLPGFDLAIVFNTTSHSFTSDIVTLLGRARYRIGPTEPTFPGMKGNPFYNLEVSIPPEKTHMSERHLSIVEPLGVSIDETRERMHVGRRWEDEAVSLIESWGADHEGLLFAIHPGGARAFARWPLEKYAELGDRLSLLPNAKVVMIAGRGESWGEDVARHMKTEPIICKVTVLKLLAAILKQVQVYVGNDTGLLHVAASVGTKSVGIYGRTDPDIWKPKGSHVIALRSEVMNMNTIEVEEVYSAVMGLLQ